MTTHFVSRITPPEMDRRNSEYYNMLLTGYSFVASIVILSLGVIFVNISNLIEYVRVTGCLYVIMGLLFLITGTLLALTIVTNKKTLFSNLWFGVVGILIIFHIVDLGYKILALVENGKKKDPDPLIAVFYGGLFAFGYGSIIAQAFCVGLVLHYRRFSSQDQSTQGDKSDVTPSSPTPASEAKQAAPIF